MHLAEIERQIEALQRNPGPAPPGHRASQLGGPAALTDPNRCQTIEEGIARHAIMRAL